MATFELQIEVPDEFVTEASRALEETAARRVIINVLTGASSGEVKCTYDPTGDPANADEPWFDPTWNDRHS
jgi:hypothetical protein